MESESPALSSIKEINRMSNIFLKSTIEKNGSSQKFDFPSLKTSSPGQFLKSSNLGSIIEFQNLLYLKNQRLGSKCVCGFPIILAFKGIMTF